MTSFDVVILGGGNAAGYVCRELVANNYPGSVVILSSESVAPYERPALTKAFLHPPSAKVRARLPGFHTCVGGGGERQEPQWYADHNIVLRLNCMVTNVDTANKTVLTKHGDTIQYGTLVHACGSDYIKLSDFKIAGDGLPGVRYLREEHEAQAMVQTLEQLKSGSKVVVIGGGFIGLEVAAATIGWGFPTTTISLGPIMHPIFPVHLCSRMAAEYASRGVSLVEGSVAEVVSTANGLEVRLQDGRTLECSLVVVGIGAKPRVVVDAELVAGCLTVDDTMRTSIPDVLAVGDSAAPNIGEERRRLQAVDWARKSAAFAAKTICGIAYTFSYVPFNYSRVFEYTDKAIVWNFFGNCNGNMLLMKTCSESVGAIWDNGGKVTGALILGSPAPPAEEIEEARRLVTEAAEVPSSGIIYAVKCKNISPASTID